MVRIASKTSLLAALALRAAAAAEEDNDKQSYRQTISTTDANPNKEGTLGYDLFEKANAHPNTARSVTWKPYESFTEEPEIADREWTWRRTTPFPLSPLHREEKEVTMKTTE